MRFGAELILVHSPLLKESWLVSFSPPSYMLKFSGCSHLIRGQTIQIICTRILMHSSTLTTMHQEPFTSFWAFMKVQFSKDRRIILNVPNINAKCSLEGQHSDRCGAEKYQHRNVHSKYRCSMCLQFTLSLAASCVLHRFTSLVIHHLEFFFTNIWQNSYLIKWTGDCKFAISLNLPTWGHLWLHTEQLMRKQLKV